MKNSIFLLLLALSTALNAQITLENTYNGSAYITDIEGHGIKYFDMDVLNNTCKLYNPDHSLWKSIPLDVPSDNYLSDVRYVSADLFSTDDLVELCYTFYNYDTLNQYYTYTTNVINENGDILLTIPGASYVEVVSAGSGDFKYLAYVWDYSVTPSTLQTEVYDLPGEPDYISEHKYYMGAPYPNPAKETIHVPLSKEQQGGTVILMDASGRVLQKQRVENRAEKAALHIEGLTPGNYYVQFLSGRKSSEIKKFIKN